MSLFKLHMVTALSSFYDGYCVSLQIPLKDGMYGIREGHVNAISTLSPGTIKYTLPDHTCKKALVSEGLVKIENGEVVILAESIKNAESTDNNT